MIAHLAKKELREQRRMLLGLLIAELVMIGLNLIAESRTQASISRLAVLRAHLLVFVPLGAMALCQAVFAKELRTRTVLFLEALPTSRWAVAVAKTSVAAGSTLLLVSLVFGSALLETSRHEVLTAQAFLALAVRCYSWTLVVLSLAILGAVLGRYRIPLYLTLFLMLFFYDQAGGKASGFGPLQLVGASFETEPALGPDDRTALWISAAIFVTALSTALWVLFSREGSVAILLGERMSHRERLVISAVLIGALFVESTLMEKRGKPPYQLTGDRVIARKSAKASLQIEPGQRPPERWVDPFFSSLESLRDYLEVEQLEPAFVVHRADLDADRFESGSLKEREGALVRANLDSESLDPIDLSGFVIRQLLDRHTRERDRLDGRRWVRDGFSEFWAQQSSADRSPRRELELLRALYAQQAGLDFGDLSRWSGVSDRVSEPLAVAFAWSVLDTLREARGDDGIRPLAAEILKRIPRDIRALAHQHSAPAIALLEGLSGIGPAELEQRWRTKMTHERERLAVQLAALPRIDGRFTTVRLSELSRAIAFSAEISDRSGSGSPPRVAIVYDELWGLDEEISRQSFERESFDAEGARQGRLPRTFARGARLFLSFAFYLPELGCEVLSSAERRTLD